MSKIAFIFPGQGSQHVGMGDRLAHSYEAARRVFERANEVLGFDLASLCWSGPEEKLDLTEYTQPAILAASWAAMQVLTEQGVRPWMVAGHSVGEYTALVAAEGLSFEEALTLVQKRGRYMQKAVEPGRGAMAAILGLSRAEVDSICQAAQEAGTVSPANINSPVQIVIAGEKPAVDRAAALARERGAKRVVPLSVSVPSHCRLMEPAAGQLAADLKKADLKELKVPLVANVHARVITKPEEVREALTRQLASPVLWMDLIEKMKADGVGIFVEVGPGKVLSGLVKRIVTDATILHVEDPESLAETVEAVRSGG
jgi:[acyl-carrier-protein] S-malonyltransferase